MLQAQINTLYWELNENEDLRQYEIEAAKELSKIDICRVIYDISYIKNDYTSLFEINELILRDQSEITYVILNIENINNIYGDNWESFNNYKFTIYDFSCLETEKLNKVKQLIINNKNVEIEIEVCKLNYMKVAEAIEKLYEVGVRIVCIKTLRFGTERILGKELLFLVRTVNRLDDSLNDLCIYVDSPMKYVLNINENTRDAHDIHDVYIDKEGYIGVSNFLPTYYEHIKNGVLYGWRMYIALYLKQDIEFTFTRQGMIENYNSVQETVEDRFKYGFYNVVIPHIVKCYQIQENYLIDIRNSNKIKINQMAYKILSLISKERSISILGVANAFVSKENRDIMGAGYADVFNFLRYLWDKKIIYLEWRNILLNESTIN